MVKKRAKKIDGKPREVMTGRVTQETKKLVDRFLAKSELTKSELINDALYDYLTR